jgi:hypothetical protein
VGRYFIAKLALQERQPLRHRAEVRAVRLEEEIARGLDKERVTTRHAEDRSDLRFRKRHAHRVQQRRDQLARLRLAEVTQINVCKDVKEGRGPDRIRVTQFD